MVSLKSRQSARLFSLLLLITLSSCEAFSKNSTSTTTSSGGPYLYIASGASYGGNGVVLSTASNTIVRYSLTGAFDRIIYDYNASPGDQPTQMLDYDANYLLVLVENAGGGRRVDKVAKDGSGVSTFISNAAITGAIVRALIPTYDGGWLVSRTGLIEKFNSARARVLAGAASWITTPAGSCATSTTLIPSMVEGPSSTIIFAHAAAAQNRLAQISKTGYNAAADCISATSAPTATHYPTFILKHSGSGKYFVAYSNTTGPIYQIYSYSPTAAAIGAGTLVYNDPSVSQGVTAMVELPDSRILVANGAPSMNTIEEFQYNSSVPSLDRVGTTFIMPSVYTKSVSSMIVAN